MSNIDVDLMAHLMRRAGFGATRKRINELAAQGYENSVEELFKAVENPNRLSDNLIRR